MLHLVSSHEVDILDIPLLPVIDGFVSVLSQQGEQIDFNQLSEFLLVAAILIELKSQRLLPGREATDEEEDDLVGWEERDLLLGPPARVPRLPAAAADVFVPPWPSKASRSMPREVGRFDDDFIVHAPDLLGRDHADGPGPGLPAGVRPSARCPGWICPTSRWTPSRSPRPWPTSWPAPSPNRRPPFRYASSRAAAAASTGVFAPRPARAVQDGARDARSGLDVR